MQNASNLHEMQQRSISQSKRINELKASDRMRWKWGTGKCRIGKCGTTNAGLENAGPGIQIISSTSTHA